MWSIDVHKMIKDQKIDQPTPVTNRWNIRFDDLVKTAGEESTISVYWFLPTNN